LNKSVSKILNNAEQAWVLLRLQLVDKVVKLSRASDGSEALSSTTISLALLENK